MLVNNRPDGEEAGQPTSAELPSRADAAGLGYRHIPLVGVSIGDSDVAAFADALGPADRPVLGFSPTGPRATTLWALGQAGNRPPEELPTTGSAAPANATRQ